MRVFKKFTELFEFYYLLYCEIRNTKFEIRFKVCPRKRVILTRIEQTKHNRSILCDAVAATRPQHLVV